MSLDLLDSGNRSTLSRRPLKSSSLQEGACVNETTSGRLRFLPCSHGASLAQFSFTCQFRLRTNAIFLSQQSDFSSGLLFQAKRNGFFVQIKYRRVAIDIFTTRTRRISCTSVGGNLLRRALAEDKQSPLTGLPTRGCSSRRITMVWKSFLGLQFVANFCAAAQPKHLPARTGV